MVLDVIGLNEYYQAKARSLDLTKRQVYCQDIFTGLSFALPFDFLVIATGSKTNTFGTPGVKQNEGKDVFFLKHLYHARGIRNRIIECFERATNPTLSQEEVTALLSFLVVGGGPTSCEFATELSDFIKQDVPRWYPHLSMKAKITLVEAGPRILGTFDASLVDYYQANMVEQGVRQQRPLTLLFSPPIFLKRFFHPSFHLTCFRH